MALIWSATFEGWVKAQPDSRGKEFLALCNKLADAKATEYLKQSHPGEFFPTSGQVPGTVFHIKGDVVLCLSASMDKVYADLMVEKARRGVAGWDARWSPVSQVKSLMEGALGVEEAKKVMLVRQLGMQEEREQAAGTCHWCGQMDSLRGSHLQHHCPEFYLRAVQAFHVE